MLSELSPALAAIAAGQNPGEAARLAVRIAAPDIRPHLGGNVLPGVWSFAASAPGPHLVVVAVLHGNEIGGAVVLDRWLRAGLRPSRGRLTLVFGNLDAYARFDPSDPTASRFVDEDLNRVWDLETLEGGRRSSELRRARLLRPVFESADVLLDLHSMLWPSDPLILAGRSPRAAALGLTLGEPALVVADDGHLGGRRLIDFAAFTAPAAQRTAILLEAGAHWEAATVATMESTAARLLRHYATVGLGDTVLVPAGPKPGPARLVEVTRTVTARTAGFAFIRPFRGGYVVPERNTLLALDGEEEVRTPHDDCVLVMPSLRTSPGHTAVRLARFVER
ncbi:M14 family metallopeptidase [Siccirubricoccus phaeus]|uniref:succinylglutamate desuccinylase/aspartoacylase domain-containing protein n=1 Tax=Siccirubricoccus phaeus TaxID=2595053 RepID=UPI0011F2FEC3|nr:succinylglutamate desuccinylase/aspartoacylase family protein [Siccirubricoccus phaeus]